MRATAAIAAATADVIAPRMLAIANELQLCAGAPAWAGVTFPRREIGGRQCVGGFSGDWQWFWRWSRRVTSARAANGAYVVDDAEAAAPGACRVESWASFASNRDFIGAAAPGCGVPFIVPAEISGLFLRTRTDGEWGTVFAPKGKVNLLPAEVGKVGLGASLSAAFDLLTGETAAVFATVPITYKMSEEFRVHLQRRMVLGSPERHSLRDIRRRVRVGVRQTVHADRRGLRLTRTRRPVSTQTSPRAQLGLRFTPIESLDFDVIYGRNISGENANWITIGMNLRFPVPGK